MQEKRRIAAIIFIVLILTVVCIELVNAGWLTNLWEKILGIFNKNASSSISCSDTSRLCSDTDGGLNEFARGMITESCNNRSKNNTDYCDEDGVGLNEYSCNNKSKIVVKKISCGEGCFNGACKKNETNEIEEDAKPECTDSDGGVEYSAKGSVTGKFNNTLGVTKEDYCDANEENILFEFSCDENGEIVANDYICDEKCEDGKCNNMESTLFGEGEMDGCTNLSAMVKSKIQDLIKTSVIILKEGEQIDLDEHFVISSPPSGKVMMVSLINNASIGDNYTSDKVTFIDDLSDREYKATITSKGKGELTVGGRTYVIDYFEDRSVLEDGYITINFPETPGGQVMVFNC